MFQMFHRIRLTWTLLVTVATVLCAALVTEGAIAATPKLGSIAVTPAASSIAVGQRQIFTATGTFSNGSKHALGPDVANIAAGYGSTCMLLKSGGVECWGANGQGELGDGTTTSSLVARPVVGISAATAVTSSRYEYGHSCALLSNGTVKCWGHNYYGQLGNGTITWRATRPVTVSGISTAIAVSAGNVHSCALLAVGTVQCWGLNSAGELGDGTNSESSVPRSVVGLSTAAAISAGGDFGVGGGHTCALLSSGVVKCWGANNFGQLGDGTTTNSNTPVTVLGINTGRAIAAGGVGTCALLGNGTVQCWGAGGGGELGDGSNTNASSTPVIVAGISSAVAIIAGSDHNCALLSSGAVMCWGGNAYGQLGKGAATMQSSNLPIRVTGISGPTRIASGDYHLCALFSGGLVNCWGWDHDGQLGIGLKNDTSNPSPANVTGTPGVVWQSSDSSKATITDRGVATGHAAGNTTITATTAGLINDNALLTVK
jgi:alpha-tubulin suppressor-like RCC1 family protein